jgi:hypothetical protein
MIFFVRTGLHFFFALAILGSAAGEAVEDHRAWQHGIDLIRVGDRLLVVWGSAGNPPRPNLGGDWPHDIYAAWLHLPLLPGQQVPLLEPQLLVSRPEAQEPPSTAINALGTVLVTAEDGQGGINQQAGLWDSTLQVRHPYPLLIKRGGHSGHVAALGERFLVTYGEGWVDGGGFLDRGTGKDIYARIVDNDGRRRKEVRIASGHRDGWPLVAASERNALVLWQRYPERTLQSALLDAEGRVVARRQISTDMPLRYAYDVEYAAQLALFVVAGSTGAEGFVSLLNREGEIVRSRKDLPPMNSESRIVLHHDGSQLMGVYPIRPHGVAVVRLAPEAIELVKIVDHPHVWDYAGTTGLFITDQQVVFATLSTSGLQLMMIDLSD